VYALWINYLYYWFSVGEGTLPLHHLIFEITPDKKNLYYWFSVGEDTLPLHHLISEITPDKKHTPINRYNQGNRHTWKAPRTCLV
jgi:hypothetical protein